MLTRRARAKAEGRDVVVGVVETHGRAETEALLEGSTCCRASRSSTATASCSEFDLDAALARRPSLLLVDEYAHTNVPGSRHPKRWQDVEELLAAGIDVWTTLNVQHLESLNDVVQKITQRARAGDRAGHACSTTPTKSCWSTCRPTSCSSGWPRARSTVQDTAARAVENFFKPQNLTALRELALRRAAERIDADLVERMQAQAIEGPWAGGRAHPGLHRARRRSRRRSCAPPSASPT